MNSDIVMSSDAEGPRVLCSFQTARGIRILFAPIITRCAAAALSRPHAHGALTIWRFPVAPSLTNCVLLKPASRHTASALPYRVEEAGHLGHLLCRLRCIRRQDVWLRYVGVTTYRSKCSP